MAGDPIDSDSSVGSKRRINSDTEQDQETLQLSSPLPEITPSHHNHTQDSTPQEEAIMSDSSPKKKAKCFSLLHEGNQELGLHSSTEKNAFLSGSLDKEKIDNAETKEGSFGVQEVDSQINAIQDVDLGFDEKRAIKEKASESENVLEAEKKRLLGDLEVGKIFGAETCHTNISGSSMNSSKIEFDLPVRGSLKIEVIDDTALIGSFPLSRTGNGSVKNEKKGKEEIDGKKAKKSRRKGKNAKKVFAEPVNHTEPTKMVEVQRCKKESNSRSKIMYSTKELEALRYAKVGEQRKLWRDVYSGLGNDVIREYEGLGSWKNQKKINWSFDHRFGRQAASPATLGDDYSENMDNELVYMDNNETENIYTLDLTTTTTCDAGVGDSFIDVEEEECIEDDDSDEDYTSILRPAFMIEGEPDFNSGPPEDGLEYLRRVRWEAIQIPKVKIAKPDKTKLNKEQSVYMPQIPEIAKCPEHLLPSKQWEEAFLADFSELRKNLSYLEDPTAEMYCKLPKVSVQQELCQFPENVVTEEFQNPETIEANIFQTSLSNAADCVILQAHQKPCANTSVSDTCGDYPTLSAIRKMDSVARVSMLRKRISSVEPMGSLSRSNCMWLFALCAAVDTPLDADTCASLRSMLRKCANLRAGKSEVDDEVVMLNILATISGRYFGQSET